MITLENMIIWFILFGFAPGAESDNVTILASWRDSKFQVLDKFWTNTGFCPLGDDAESRRNFLLSRDEKINLAIIGSVPNQGITHVRIHWILDLITVKEVGDEGAIFDYGGLDEVVHWLHNHGLVPTLELMGNPSGYFHNFGNQSEDWSRMIKQIIQRYIDLYGASYVYKWRFELMNEPDLRMYNTFNFTLEEYLDYFRASERALGKIHGPAGLFRQNKDSHPLCWGLLTYCNLNPCKLKTVTFHRKGEGVASKIVRHTLQLIDEIKRELPNITDMAYGNDEADILTGWHKPEEWRSDVRYASLVLQVVIGHIYEMYVKRSIRFQVLSNDNAFINYYPYYFNQRTLLARFQMNNTETRHSHFFRKPVYSVMGLLSLLGSYVLDIKYNTGKNGVSYVLTGEKNRRNLLGTMTNDRVNDSCSPADNTLNLFIKVLLEEPRRERVYAVYVMDNKETNPYQVWKNGGGPDFPDKSLRRKIRLSGGPKMLYYKKINGQEKITVSLPNIPNPSIFSINICYTGYKAPGPVENLHYVRINENEVLLLWSDEAVMNKCLMTYVIEFRGLKNGKFTRINEEDSLFLYYQFDGFVKGEEKSVLGEYRVAALDYFGRLGQFSEIIALSASSKI